MMHTNSKLSSILILAFVCLISFKVFAQDKRSDLKQFVPSLIPISKNAASDKIYFHLRELGISDHIKVDELKTKLQFSDVYAYSQKSPYLDVSLNAFTGNFSCNLYDFELLDKGVEVGFGEVTSNTTSFSASVIKRIEPLLKTKGFDLVKLKPIYMYENEKYLGLRLVQNSELNFVEKDGIDTHDSIHINKAEKKVSYANINVPREVRTFTHTISYEEAMGMANWLLLGDKETNVSLQDTSHFTGKIKEYWDKQLPKMSPFQAKTFYDKAQVHVRRDAWLVDKPEWALNFGNFQLRLDANTGQPVSSYSSQNRNWLQESFSTDKKWLHIKPTWYVEPEKFEHPIIKFNNQTISEVGPILTLHYFPVIKGNSCLIYSDYFPHFLVDILRSKDSITLEGQLPNKGKKAVLTLDSNLATIDGKTVTLSAPPQEIEGQLYLPYELLTLCNGVLTRYEPSKKTLYVDTRYLRRPDPVTN